MHCLQCHMFIAASLESITKVTDIGINCYFQFISVRQKVLNWMFGHSITWLLSHIFQSRVSLNSFPQKKKKKKEKKKKKKRKRKEKEKKKKRKEKEKKKKRKRNL